MTDFFQVTLPSGRVGVLSFNAADGRIIALGRIVVDPDSINGTLAANAELSAVYERTELEAAYERIDELTAVLRETADAIEDKFPNSIRASFWKYFDAIDDALNERVSA